MAGLIEHYFGSAFNLGRLRFVLGMLAAAIVATTVSGIGGTIGYVFFHHSTAPILTIWRHWFTSDALGIVTGAPLLIGIAAAVRDPPQRREVVEGIAALVCWGDERTPYFLAARALGDDRTHSFAVSSTALACGPLSATVRRDRCVHLHPYSSLDGNVWDRPFR